MLIAVGNTAPKESGDQPDQYFEYNFIMEGSFSFCRLEIKKLHVHMYIYVQFMLDLGWSTCV